MAISIGINGFGRIGRVALRIAINQPDTFKVCGINVRNADLGYMKYMIRYDSTFGRFQGELDTYENGLIIEGQKIPVFSESDAALIPWGACGAEYIIDATGAYCTTEKAKAHLEGGAKTTLEMIYGKLAEDHPEIEAVDISVISQDKDAVYLSVFWKRSSQRPESA